MRIDFTTDHGKEEVRRIMGRFDRAIAVAITGDRYAHRAGRVAEELWAVALDYAARQARRVRVTHFQYEGELETGLFMVFETRADGTIALNALRSHSTRLNVAGERSALLVDRCARRNAIRADIVPLQNNGDKIVPVAVFAADPSFPIYVRATDVGWNTDAA